MKIKTKRTVFYLTFNLHYICNLICINLYGLKCMFVFFLHEAPKDNLVALHEPQSKTLPVGKLSPLKIII